MCLLFLGQEKEKEKSKNKRKRNQNVNHFAIPIEHFLSLVNMRFQEDNFPLEITKETYVEFSERTKQSISSFSSEVTHKTID